MIVDEAIAVTVETVAALILIKRRSWFTGALDSSFTAGGARTLCAHPDPTPEGNIALIDGSITVFIEAIAALIIREGEDLSHACTIATSLTASLARTTCTDPLTLWRTRVARDRECLFIGAAITVIVEAIAAFL